MMGKVVVEEQLRDGRLDVTMGCSLLQSSALG